RCWSRPSPLGGLLVHVGVVLVELLGHVDLVLGRRQAQEVRHDQLGILALLDPPAHVQERVVEGVHAGTPLVSWYRLEIGLCATNGQPPSSMCRWNSSRKWVT